MSPNRIAPVIKSSQPTDDFYTDKLHFHPCLLCFLVYFVFLTIIHPPSLVSSNCRFRVPLSPLHEHIHHQTSCQSRYSIFLVPPGGCSPNNQSYSMPRGGYGRPKGSSPYQLQGNPAVSKQYKSSVILLVSPRRISCLFIHPFSCSSLSKWFAEQWKWIIPTPLVLNEISASAEDNAVIVICSWWRAFLLLQIVTSSAWVAMERVFSVYYIRDYEKNARLWIPALVQGCSISFSSFMSCCYTFGIVFLFLKIL